MPLRTPREVFNKLHSENSSSQFSNLSECQPYLRRRANHQSSKRVHDGEATPVEESHSANTSCSVLNVAVSVFAETTPSFFASRVLSTARI
jgi:hypothetical protein